MVSARLDPHLLRGIMVQFLASVVEWIALAGLSLLGIDYAKSAHCESENTGYETVEYVVIESHVDTDWLDPHHNHHENVWSCGEDMLPELISIPGQDVILTEI